MGFLRQADAWELNHLFRALEDAEKAGDNAKAEELVKQIDNHETHVVPIIADIDAGFGNAEATYLLAKQMIEAGACCIQIGKKRGRKEEQNNTKRKRKKTRRKK